MAETQDTEITLGTGKLLGLFFGLVILCAVFFGLGYSVGHNAEKSAAAPEGVTLPAPTAGATKPIAGKPGTAASVDCAAHPELCANGNANAEQLTFYKSVEQNQTEAQLTPPPPAPLPVTTSTPLADAKPTPEIAKPASNSGPYIVQVAAVSKQEDADALVTALKKKQYAVFVGTAPTDKLFHVQVGPFADLKEAETIRGKLLGDGYNPILKK